MKHGHPSTHPHAHHAVQRSAQPVLTLDLWPAHAEGVIHSVMSHHPHGHALQRRLLELGFVPGERIQILRKSMAGHGPMAVRVGGSTFALRQLESSLIQVSPA
jgi:ferrous iron transport protein A